MSRHDALQRVGEAAYAIIDVDVAVVALTGRASGNIVRFDPRTPVVSNSLAYLATDAKRRTGGIGENYDVTLVLRAEADGKATSDSAPEFASKLLDAAIEALAGTGGVAALEANGVDAVVTDIQPHTPQDDAGDSTSTNPANVATEVELTIWITL